MRIAIFGAAGRIGRCVVAEAMTRGHDVTAVARDPDRLLDPPLATRLGAGDATAIADVARLATTCDVMVSATRPASGDEADLVTAAHSLLTALSGTGVRLLLVGGAASLIVPGTEGRTVLEDPRFRSPTASRALATACVEQLAACRAASTDVDWAYLSPPARLVDGPRTGVYRLGRDELLLDAAGQSAITVPDLAVALLDEVERPAHHQTRFTAAY